MERKDVRWKQRFANFEKAVGHLQAALAIKNPSDLEKAGVVQIYEFTFELAWKTVKDYLEEKLVPVKFPRDTIKQGFLFDLIKNGDVWMDMLQKRNLMTHTYNEKNAELAYTLILTEYFTALFDLYNQLKNELS